MVKPFQTGNSTTGNPKSLMPYIKFFKGKVLNTKLQLFGKYSVIFFLRWESGADKIRR